MRGIYVTFKWFFKFEQKSIYGNFQPHLINILDIGKKNLRNGMFIYTNGCLWFFFIGAKHATDDTCFMYEIYKKSVNDFGTFECEKNISSMHVK